MGLLDRRAGNFLDDAVGSWKSWQGARGAGAVLEGRWGEGLRRGRTRLLGVLRGSVSQRMKQCMQHTFSTTIALFVKLIDITREGLLRRFILPTGKE
jgi:hypothetical protein